MRIFGCMGQRKVKSMDISKKKKKLGKHEQPQTEGKKLKIQMTENLQISTKPNAYNFRQHSNAFSSHEISEVLFSFGDQTIGYSVRYQ